MSPADATLDLTPEQIASLAQLALVERQLAQANTIKGERGDPGPQGDQGERGLQGERGPQGDQGERGLQGIPGRDGRDGKHGRDGSNGTNGRDGKDGTDGKDGADGSFINAWRGEWVKGKPYKKGDIVAHQGSSYIAKADTTLAPTIASAWDPVALRGADGHSMFIAGGSNDSAPATAARQLYVQQTQPTFTVGTPAQWWQTNPDGSLKTLWVYDGAA